MGTLTRHTALVLLVSLVLAVFGKAGCAQMAASTAGSAQQPGANSSQPKPSSTTGSPEALEDPILEQADEDRNITYMDSTVAFEYRHEELDGGMTWDNFELHWQQSFGRSRRLAVEFLLPFIRATAGQDEPGASGVGDIKLGFKGMLSKGEKFENAAGVEVTVPSASHDPIGDGETVLRFAWGCSAQLSGSTLLNAELGYNKPVQNSRSTNAPGTNSIEPELILTQGITKRFAGYLDWDNYYDFSASDYVSTMQTGIEFTLDPREKWTVTPYATFALTHATRLLEIKNAAGVIFSYRY